MLIKFTFKNHRSFLDEQVFSMEADQGSDDGSVSPVEGALLPRSAGILRAGAVFGTTASGKSNFLSALDYMKRVVMLSASKVQIARLNETFAFQTGADLLDSHYEVEIIENGKYYRYGFVIRAGEIVKEWLFRRSERLTPLFTRDQYSLKVKGMSPNQARMMAPSPSTLFLTVAQFLNLDINPGIQDCLSWFSRLMVVMGPRREDLLVYAEKEDYLKAASEIIAAADFGILSLSLIHEGSYIDIETTHKLFDRDGRPAGVTKTRLFQDRGLHSDGTLSLICALGLALKALDTGACLCVDDFGMGAPHGAAKLAGLFKGARGESQIVFTSASTSLITRAALRRDQIWFTSRDERSGTHLSRLSDLPGVRRGDNLERKLIESPEYARWRIAPPRS